MTDNLLQNDVGRKRDRAANVGESTMGGHELEAVPPVNAHDAEDADVGAVFEVLLTQIVRDVASFPNRADVEFLTTAGRELAFRGERGNAPEHCFLRRLELDEEELPVHRDRVQVRPVRNREIGVKLEPALSKAAEHANNAGLGE